MENHGQGLIAKMEDGGQMPSPFFAILNPPSSTLV
jgi:hypothetical protein